jgi:hypothetical protein
MQQAMSSLMSNHKAKGAQNNMLAAEGSSTLLAAGTTPGSCIPHFSQPKLFTCHLTEVFADGQAGRGSR